MTTSRQGLSPPAAAASIAVPALLRRSLRLLVEANPQELRLHLLDLVRLRGRDRGQQAAGRVEGAVGVVAGEGLLVRPLVAMVAEFAHQAALGGSQSQAEHLIPGVPHDLEKRRHVQYCDRLLRVQAVLGQETLEFGRGSILVNTLELTLDEGA